MHKHNITNDKIQTETLAPYKSLTYLFTTSTTK